MRLTAIRAADWNARASIATGTSAGGSAFWSSDGTSATLMIGHDDEVWDVAVTVPLDVVDDLVRRRGLWPRSGKVAPSYPLVASLAPSA